MKQKILITLLLFSFITAGCGRHDNTDYSEVLSNATFPSSGAPAPSGNDAISASTNFSGKENLHSPKLNALAGTGYVAPPQINNYGSVSLSYPLEVTPGRRGMGPQCGLSFSSSGGDGLAGIGWSLGTGLGVISRTTRHGQLYYDYRDTFTYNGKRLIKVSGPARSENGVYRLEIESGFSRFELNDAENGGTWHVYDKSGTVTIFGQELNHRIYHPDENHHTYIWNFSRSTDLNGNFMYAVYDDSDYNENHILYLKEIRYTGNEATGEPARQYVRFEYQKRDDAYVSKAPGFVMIMDRLLDKVIAGWDNPSLFGSNDLWEYRMVYKTSAVSSRPLLQKVESTRTTTTPEFEYEEGNHLFVWQRIRNPHVASTEENPQDIKYFEGDFNGDGISDMVFFNPNTGDWNAAEGHRDGGYIHVKYGNKFRGYAGKEMIRWFKGNVTGDFNGDGRSDIAFYLPRTKEFWVAEHNGIVFQFRNYGTLTHDTDIFACEWFTGDYDGNGLSDTVFFDEKTGDWILMRNSGGHFEFITFANKFKHLFRSDYTGEAASPSAKTSDTALYGKDREKVKFLSGDFNGDGRTDISIYDGRTGQWWVGENYLQPDASTSLSTSASTSLTSTSSAQRSTGTGFKMEWIRYRTFTAPQQALFAHDRFSGDYDGDGFSDFLIFNRERNEWWLGKTGDRTIAFSYFSSHPGNLEMTRWIQGDFNGDGRTDVGFYSATDSGLWVGETTPSGFRFKRYNRLSESPDAERILAAPLPQDEVVIEKTKGVAVGNGVTTIMNYEFDGNYHSFRGEQVFAGHFTSSTNPELLIYDKNRNRLLIKRGSNAIGTVMEGVDLQSKGTSVVNKGRPVKFDDKDAIVYYKGAESVSSGTTHSFSVIRYDAGWGETLLAEFDDSVISGFSHAESKYWIDTFKSSDILKNVLVLDDNADVPAFVRFAPGGTNERLRVAGDLEAGFFKNLRRKKTIHILNGALPGQGAAGLILIDTSRTSHQWYKGVISAGNITFTKLSGLPRFITGDELVSHTMIDAGSNSKLTYISKAGGRVTVHVIEVGSTSVRNLGDYTLSLNINTDGYFDHEGNPVVQTSEGYFSVICTSTGYRLNALTGKVDIIRPDLRTQVYPFQWIQGDYNGDGKTDLGFFHMKEQYWYFANSYGGMADMLTTVRNGIGGSYKFTYENSTRFDNTGDDRIPDLPMNYKVCTILDVLDGLGSSIRTHYAYEGGYAFSAFINGYKETDYFGFGKFTVRNAVGIKNVSEYENVPYNDFRKNRALAGAIKVSRTIGSDGREYARTEYEYTIHTIVPSPSFPLPGGEGGVVRSYLVEPTEVRTYKAGALMSTQAQSIEITPGRYELAAKTTTAIDHYTDGIHSETRAETCEEFDNIDATNEMRLVLKKNFVGTKHETSGSYDYDEKGNVTEEVTRYTGSGLTAPPDMIVRYEYDNYGNRIRSTNASGSPGRVTETDYDTNLYQFPVKSRAYGDSIVLETTREYDYGKAFGQMTKSTDPNGASTYIDYDSYGRIKNQRTDTESGIATLNYYEYITQLPLSAKVTRYSGAGHEIVSRNFVDGMARTLHTVQSATDQGGKRFVKSGKIVYDRAGRMIRRSQTGWCDESEIDRYVPHKNEKYPTITEYDAIGRVKKVTLPEGYEGEAETSSVFTYNDPYETIITTSAGRSKRTVKNGRGQILYIDEWGTGDPSTGSGTNSGTGEVTRASIGFAYDLAGNRIKKMDLMPSPPAPLPGGEGSGMSLDVPSHLFAPGLKDTSGANIAVWKYDGFGRLVEASDPDLGYRKVEYNTFGETTRITDAKGDETDMRYDRLGRLIEKILPGTEGSVYYRYDSYAGSSNGRGRMVAMEDPSQSKTFSYDRIGRVKQETRVIKGSYPVTFTTNYSYDLLGRKREIEYPVDPKTGKRITARYSYTPFGIKNLEIWNGELTKSIISNVDYNEFGQMETVSRGNGTVTRYTYDIKGRLSRLLTTASHNGTISKVQDVTYKFKVDNSIEWVENRPDINHEGSTDEVVRYEYKYDGLNRLVRARGSFEKVPSHLDPGSPPNPPEGGSVSKKFERGYRYASNGNLTGKTIFDPESGSVQDDWRYTYGNHAVTRIDTTTTGGRFEMQYDANGNMTLQRDNEKNMAKEMAYDSYNRIRMVTDPDTGTVRGEYWYDDQGFRVRKKAVQQLQGETRNVELLYPSMYFCVEQQTTLKGKEIKNTGYGVSNIYMNGVRVAAVIPDGSARFYLTDQVDSVKVITDDSGLIVSRMEYLPYGETWFQEGDDKHSPKYNSQELDKETGYYFYNARHYDPEVGRFVTADTVVDGEKRDKNGRIIASDSLGWDRYMYCRGNPIIYKDPTGHESSRSGLWAVADWLHHKFGSGSSYWNNDTNNNDEAKKLSKNKSGDSRVLPGGKKTEVVKSFKYTGGPDFVKYDKFGNEKSRIKNYAGSVDIIRGDFIKNTKQWSVIDDFKNKEHYEGSDNRTQVDLSNGFNESQDWWGPNRQFRVDAVVPTSSGYGSRIRISVLDDNGDVMTTVDMGHFSEINEDIYNAKKGDVFDAGTYLGRSNKSIGYTTGPHLHMQSTDGKSRNEIQKIFSGK